MKKIIFLLIAIPFFIGCKSKSPKILNKNEILATIDLLSVENDKVLVNVIAPKINSDTVTYHVPKIIPGTYSEDNFGKFIDDFKALDAEGNSLKVTKSDDNSWIISEAKNLKKVTYWVNDTFDVEKTHKIFSPAGTNISIDNYLINPHGFIGYFTDLENIKYILKIKHPIEILANSALTDYDESTTKDEFEVNRYEELIENPIMYCKPNSRTFEIDGMTTLISVYSPNNIVTAESITPKLKEVLEAQKKYLGKLNHTEKYAILLYLTDIKKNDAKGFGALEHPTSTTVVLPEIMKIDAISEQLKDIVSHEFFHTITPLSIHSDEIQNFDFINPKMSQHLWMYEGVTEYFANLFQVNQGLISEDEFYSRMNKKIENANKMNDKMSFTLMSQNILKSPYKEQYLNVYEKGALIAMCIDIQIREKSNGENSLLKVMQKLSSQFGENKSFNDDDLFDIVAKYSNNEVGDFLYDYVLGTKPIDYDSYFARMGVSKITTQIPENVFAKGNDSYLEIKNKTKDIVVKSNMELPPFFNSLGLKNNDLIVSVNNTKYNSDSFFDLIDTAQNWNEEDQVTLQIKRNGKPKTLKGKIKKTYQISKKYSVNDSSKNDLRNAWLKN
jgi:predicted metalloprotease with PDZ domain